MEARAISPMVPIPGYGGRYLVTREADIYRVCPDRLERVAQRYRDGKTTVRLKGADGKVKERLVSRIVAEAYVPAPGDIKRLRVIHRNGVKVENAAWNLKWTTQQLIGKQYGYKANQRSVEKLTENGVFVEIYRSARQAGRLNAMSYQTVLDYCNGKNKRQKTAPDGFIYRWED